MRLFCTAALVLSAFGASAGVVVTTLSTFEGLTNGAAPLAGLVQGSDGNFYGTTLVDGNLSVNNGFGDGTVFQISANGALTNLYSFTGGNDGANPQAGLVQGRDGYFYGTTSESRGTNNGAGTVFQISTNGALTNLYSFSGGNDGDGPNGLVQGSDGYFYGTTELGGTNSNGTVFQITTNGTLTNLYSFTGGNDGDSPQAGLVQGSDGYFYGTTSSGGLGGPINGAGTVFKIGASGALTTLYSFGKVTNAHGVPLDGANPVAGLVQGSDGYFYGTTEGGGRNNAGAVFQLNTNGTLTNLYSFTGGNDGGLPQAGLALGSDGNFYGTTVNGGTNNAGTVFKISTNGAFTSLYSFTGGIDGANPYAGLVQGSDGSFYGTTAEGSQGNAGTVFRLTIVPEFLSVSVTNGVLSLTWSTEAGGTYQLEYNDHSDLNSSNWVNLGTPVVATGATRSFTDANTTPNQKFYRVLLLP